MIAVTTRLAEFAPETPAPGARRLVLAPGSTYPNGLPWKPYVYRGTGRDELTAWMDDLPDETPARPGRAASSPCGTPAAYRRHLRREGKPVRCEACLAAERRQGGDKRANDGWREAYNERRRERYADAVAAGLSAPQAQQVRDSGLRCRDCGYLVTTAGHKIACGEAA